MAEHAHHHGAAAHASPDDQYLETPPGSTYEHTDAHVGPMVKFAIWLVASAIIVHVGLAAMYWLLVRESTERVDTQRYPLAVDTPPRLPAEPRLQQFPRNELYEFRVKEALISGVALAVLAVGVFVVGLSLQLPIWPGQG